MSDLEPLPRLRSTAATLATWHRSSIGSVSEAWAPPHSARGAPFPVSRFHLLIPLGGCFEWGHDGWTHVASNQHTLYVPGGREYRVSHFASGEHSLLIVPRAAFLDELGWRGRFHPQRLEVRHRGLQLTLRCQRLLSRARSGASELEVDELLCDLVARLGTEGQRCADTGERTSIVLRRAKSFLQEQLGSPASLAEVASHAGVSPIYLTNLFRRVEGVPLHQYLMRLRLAESLDRLEMADDITDLAYELGFSSHSHFTAAFRTRLAQTPRQTRLELRRAPRGRPLAQRAVCVARGGSEAVPDLEASGLGLDG